MVVDEQVHVVRAHRFELLDEANRVRAVIGSTQQDDGPLVGLDFFDAAGSARAWLLDEDGVGVRLAFAIAGNQVLVASAGETRGEVGGGACVVLCDRDGVPVLSWQVGADGTITQTGGAPGSTDAG